MAEYLYSFALAPRGMKKNLRQNSLKLGTTRVYGRQNGFPVATLNKLIHTHSVFYENRFAIPDDIIAKI